MKENQEIQPASVTKPIQLLAAWLVGLIAINSSYLTAASFIDTPAWASSALVIAAIANTPIFLACLFLLQTKFRPEMQEDSYYAQHLERKFSEITKKVEVVNSENPPKIAVRRKPIFKVEGYEDYSIEVNDLLPDFQNIYLKIVESGLGVTSTFGTTSADPKPPTPFIVAISERVPVHVSQEIIKICLEFGLAGVGYASFPDNGIYVGSYSYEDHENYVHVGTEEFDRIRQKGISQREFLNVIRHAELGG